MIRYIESGCYKCDFSEGQSDHYCKKDMCNNFEPTYIKTEINYEIGWASLKEFNKAHGTNWKE